MKVGDISDSLMPMLEDGKWAEGALEKDDNQFTRRAYVRSMFSIIEGSIWVLKQTILQATVPKGRIVKMSVAEYSLLSDRSYDLKSNGIIQEKVKYLKLPDNLVFTFGLLAKYFGAEFNLGIGEVEWENFRKAQVIRDRITHPKAPAEFNISDAEIAICRATSTWFNKLIAAFFDRLKLNAKKINKA